MESAAHRIAAAPAALPPLPDEILEDIFLRLSAADGLARASAACTTFRRLVSARCFLRRFRSLHPPPVLGFLDADPFGMFYPAEPPHRSAPAGRAFAQAADFTFSFVPKPNMWTIRDARDGRVLLSRQSTVATALGDLLLLVCDPLHGRYVQIPPISLDMPPLPASTRRLCMQGFEPFLAPAVDEEMEEELSYRVIVVVLSKGIVMAFVFSSVTGKWQGCGAPFRFDFSPLARHYQRNCLYWTCCRKNLLVLDLHKMSSSIMDLPPDGSQLNRAIVDAGGDRLGLLTFGSGSYYDNTLVLRCKKWCADGDDKQEWQHDKVIPLPDCCSRYTIIGSDEGLLLLRGVPRESSQSCIHNGSSRLERESQYFTVEVKTLLVERLCAMNYVVGPAYLYASFPPPLSLPSV